MNEITIYKIYCKDESIKDIYIGSTCDFKQRKKQHKYCCNNINGNKYKCYKYVFIRENGGFDNWIIESITTCSTEEQYKMERWHIENSEHTNLNKSIPTRTEDEWRLDNKEKLNEYAKQYKEVNKEKLKEYNKEYIKQYREVNKEKINEKKKEKMTCECGSTFRKCDKARHEKTNKHKNYNINLNSKVL